MQPLCFVAMPFGAKRDESGRTIDFDAVYRDLIQPALLDAGLEPIRADEESTGGMIHKAMFERLALCQFAIADLSASNANVYYELGIRHALRPWSTVCIFAKGTRLPFDLGPVRGMPYEVGSGGTPAAAEADAAALAEKLKAAREGDEDSPVFQLMDMGPPDISRLKTDVFRDRMEYEKTAKADLAGARKAGLDAVVRAHDALKPISDREYGVAVDPMLSYRAVKGWNEMITLVDSMAKPHAQATLVQEQLGFALNRAGRGDEAERVLTDLIADRGPSSETYGILGRVYKDQYEQARDAGEALRAHGFLRKAIDTYCRGFEADWRDHYPGVNAVTLMELADPPDPERERLLPVVQYAVERRLAGGEADYWDHATMLELAVLRKDEALARRTLPDVFASIREVWEPETTARNLRLISEARSKRDEDVPWVDEIVAALAGAASTP